MKLSKAVLPVSNGAASKEIEAWLRTLPVATPGLSKPQESILVDDYAEKSLVSKVAVRLGMKVTVRKTNGHGWNVWRVK